MTQIPNFYFDSLAELLLSKPDPIIIKLLHQNICQNLIAAKDLTIQHDLYFQTHCQVLPQAWIYYRNMKGMNKMINHYEQNEIHKKEIIKILNGDFTRFIQLCQQLYDENLLSILELYIISLNGSCIKELPPDIENFLKQLALNEKL